MKSLMVFALSLAGCASTPPEETARPSTPLSPAMLKAFQAVERNEPCDRARRIFENAYRNSFLGDDSRKIPCNYSRLRPTVEQFEAAIRLCPNGQWGHVARGLRCEALAHFSFYAAQGVDQIRRIRVAKKACEEAVQLDPSRVEARRPLVILAIRNENWRECIRLCDEALALVKSWSGEHDQQGAHAELKALSFFSKNQVRCTQKRGTYFPKDCAD